MRIKVITLCFLLTCGTAFAGTVDKLESVIARQNATTGGTTCSADVGETADGSSANQTAGFTWVIRHAFGCTAAANNTTFNLRLVDADTASRRIVMLIYEDNGGEPGDLVWESDPLYNVDWNSFTWVTETVDVQLSGSYLWIGFYFESNVNRYFYTSNTPARTTRTIYNTSTYPDVDAVWDADNDGTSDYGFSCYLSY